METGNIIHKWHAITNPDCENCHGLSRPVRAKRTPRHTPQIVSLALNSILADRKHLRILLRGSRLPQSDFAKVVGITQSTLYRWLHGGTIPQTKRDYLNSIQFIRRDGAEVHVVYRVYAPAPRWTAEMDRRDSRTTNPARILQDELDALSRQLFRNTGLQTSYA